MSVQPLWYFTIFRLWFKLLGVVEMSAIRSINESLTSSTLNPPNAPHFTVKSQYPSFQGPTSIDKPALPNAHLSVLTSSPAPAKLIRGGLFYFACGQSSKKSSVVLVQQMIQ